MDQAIETTGAKQVTEKISCEEFLKKYADTHAEWIGGNDRFQLIAADEKGRFHSAVLPNFWLQIEWLWQEPLPKVLDVARKLGLSDR